MEWSTVITEVVIEDSSFDGDDEIHVYCPRCDPQGKLAFCGTEIAGGEFVEDDDCAETTCIVCADMALRQCPRCGAWP